MTLPIGRYAALGPPIPEAFQPSDGMPLRMLRIEELGARNGLGEVVILVDALSQDDERRPIKIIVAVNPHTGDITRCAVHVEVGAGFVAFQPKMLPGNLCDVCRSIALETKDGPSGII